MFYGTIVRCLDNCNEWITTSVIENNGTLFYEFIIAVGRNADGNEFYEYCIIPGDIYRKILDKTYSFFINLEHKNKVLIYDENNAVKNYSLDGVQRVKKRY